VPDQHKTSLGKASGDFKAWREQLPRLESLDLPLLAVGAENTHSPGERKVFENLNRKAKAAAEMFDALVAEMHNAQGVDITARAYSDTEVPEWLTTA
jgi:hypothetical protein